MRHPVSHIFDMTPDSLADWCQRRSLARYRTDQILEWVYRKGVAEPAKMTNLARRDRDLLSNELTFLSGADVAHRRATDGVQKLLIEWTDGDAPQPTESATSPSLPILNEAGDATRQTECVLIPADRRKTACISSQVGCPVGCRFCASGMGGLDGNLSAGRIVEQVWRLSRLPRVERVTNIVFMGMGEPLANFDAVVRAVGTLAAPWGMGVSARKITISTVGLPRAIERLTERLDLPVTLALSLHAPNDELRRKLIPWAEHTTIEELIAACDGWFRRTGREITIEYVLLGGVNDQPRHALELAKVASRLRCGVNLIRYNEVAGLPFVRPTGEDVHVFQEALRSRGVTATIRASRGRDIAAACGQLRHEIAGAS